MAVELEFYEGQALSAVLPPSVVLEIKETAPVMKNANATGSYKPAILENGITVGVPPYIETGEKIRVNTAERTYMERVK
jgi:elongation factor P